MKGLKGGLYEGGSSAGCLTASACSLVVNQGGTYFTYTGNCAWMNDACKCATDYGNYYTQSGIYNCMLTP